MGGGVAVGRGLVGLTYCGRGKIVRHDDNIIE